jgi:hypothetical protein
MLICNHLILYVPVLLLLYVNYATHTELRGAFCLFKSQCLLDYTACVVTKRPLLFSDKLIVCFNTMHKINSPFLSLRAGFNNVVRSTFCQVGDESINRILINFMLRRD